MTAPPNLAPAPPPRPTNAPAGRRLLWLFSTPILVLIVLNIALARFALLDPTGSGQASHPRNVLLITIDSLRADRLGCYGHAAARTPNIDALAAEGVRFDSAFSQASSTWPSLSSIMTSTYVTTHGAWNWNFEIANRLKTLPDLLVANGYVCTFVTAHLGLIGSHAFTRAIASIVGVGRNEVVQGARTALARLRDQRFFLWAHLMDVHRSTIEYDGERFLGRAGYPSRYDRSVTQADEKVGAIVSELKQLGLYDQTLVIVTADHGDGLGDGTGGYEGHGFEVTDELVHVPLIMKGLPGIAPGTVNRELVEHVDIAPTVCDALDIAGAPTFDGHSLLPMLAGDVLDSRVVFSENVGCVDPNPHAPQRRDAWSEIRTGARTREWKVERIEEKNGRMRYALYHLTVDPEEKVDLSASEPERLANMVEMLEEWRNRPHVIRAGQPAKLDDKQRENLRNLHYNI